MQVKDRIHDLADDLTATERKLSAALLRDYPFAGLEPIQVLADSTNTSPPTISRFVTKLGFSGFQEFQRHLIAELKEGHRSPVDIKGTSRPLEGAYLETFMTRAKTLLEQSVAAISETQFQRVCRLLSDERRSIYVIGGRMSDSLAMYLSRHLRQLRSKVFHLPSDPEVWPEYLLRIKPKDIVFVVDFRRYQQSIAGLSRQANQKCKAQVVLLTDTWLSPISRHATEVLAVPTDSATVWDSYSAALAVMEALVTCIAETNWDRTKARIDDWDALRLDTLASSPTD